MGTRNLTVVKLDQKYMVAQYGQWDGYPSGQGATILEFLTNNKNFLETFAKQIRYFAKFESTEAIQAKWKECGADDSGWASMEIADRFALKYPSLSRNTAAGILDIIMQADKPIPLENSIEFAADGLFCEWCYVIDLDSGTFEVYEGFTKDGFDKNTERFGFLLDKSENEYAPVKLIKEYKLSELPTEQEFLADLEDKDAA